MRLISSIRTYGLVFDSKSEKQQPVAVMLTLQRLELDSMQSTDKHSKVSQRLSKWTAISSLALIAVTWRLWTPQSTYPQVPVLHSLCNAPLWLDWLGLGGALFGLTIVAINSRPHIVQIGCATAMVSLLLSFSLDQHRFQPWAYELLLFCGVWLCCRDPLRMNLMRWLLISVYFYSAIGKLDFEFLHTVGQQMLAVVVGGFGIDLKDLSPNLRLALVANFPCIELAIAVALAWPKTRRLAGWLAIGVHLGLIVILGPFGLNHRLGVLVWNVQVAAQTYWLFVSDQPAESVKSAFTWPQWIASAMIGAAIALPSTERLGLWDHWPSWALYAPHSSCVFLEIAGPAIDRLPPDLHKLVKATPANPDEIAIWLPVPIDAWSLETLDTPVYPQARFQLGVAERIATDINAGFQVRVTLLETASRFNGTRRATIYHGVSELTSSSQRFWVNHHPRNNVKLP